MLKSNYLDMYEGVHAEMVYTNRFDENSDLITAYLGQTKITRETRIKAEEKFLITGQGFTLGKLLEVLNVRFCYILVLAGPTCQNLTIWDAKVNTHCPNMLQTLKEFK